MYNMIFFMSWDKISCCSCSPVKDSAYFPNRRTVETGGRLGSRIIDFQTGEQEKQERKELFCAVISINFCI